MKKVLIFSGLFMVVLLAGSAFAILAGGDGGPGLETSPPAALAPQDLEEGEPVAAGNAGNRRCGSGASRCGSSGGCCGSSATGATAAVDIEKMKISLQAYFEKRLEGKITVEVKDLGCHQEAEVRQDDRVIKKLSISGREITDIT